MQLYGCSAIQFLNYGVVEGGDSIVIEFGGNGSEYREILRGCFPLFPVSLNLFADISNCIIAAFLLKFIDYDKVGIIEHINFFELGRRAIFTGHYIDGGVRYFGNIRVSLTYAGGFCNNQVKTCCLNNLDCFRKRFGNLFCRVPGRQAAHIDPV